MMNAEQKAAFLAARCGKLTASNMWRAMDYTAKGAPSAERKRLQYELLAERLTGDSVPHYVNDAMQWGIDTEDEAADAFVALTGRDLRLSRTYDHPTIDNVAATPDREIEDDGLIEIKCPTTTTFIEWVQAGTIPPKHLPQLATQLLCTGKKWVGFIAYDPRIKNERNRLFLRKYVPDPEYLAKVEAEAIKFLDELDAMFDAFVVQAA